MAVSTWHRGEANSIGLEAIARDRNRQDLDLGFPGVSESGHGTGEIPVIQPVPRYCPRECA